MLRSNSKRPTMTMTISTTMKKRATRPRLTTPTAKTTSTTTRKRKTTVTTTKTHSTPGKARRLQEILASYKSVLVAFSGGVDSAYLAIAAAATLGPRALAVTADSPSYPETHRRLALSIASDFGLAHEMIRTAELERPEYRANPANRCYYCKDELYTHLDAIAR